MRNGREKRQGPAVAAGAGPEVGPPESEIRNPESEIASGGLRFGVAAEAAAAEQATEKPKREPRRKVKNDPRFVAAARELRDRWLERVNEEGFELTAARGKYDVSRQIEGPQRAEARLLTQQIAA